MPAKKLEEIKKKPKKIAQEEFEKKVLELAKKGLTSEKIGEELRKQNIHSNDYKKKISEILGDEYIIPDIKNVETKLARVKKHSEDNKKDRRARREKERISAQLRRTKKYFKKL